MNPSAILPRVSYPDSNSARAWSALTRPARVALVGASERNPFARRTVANMTQLGFDGQLMFVNPNRKQVFDAPCYPSLDAVPSLPDCAAISVPAAAVGRVVDLGLGLGISAFIVNSAGFAEAGEAGVALQRSLSEHCRSAGAMLLGPNCMGLVNGRAGVAAFGAPLPLALRPGPVGLVSQSGSATVALLNAKRDVGFSVVASTGNEAVTTTEDVIEQFLADGETRIIVAFIESLREPRRFVDLAYRALRAQKPILALKVGNTPKGAQAAFSHTASLAGEARVYEAVFRDTGVVQVRDLDELVETLELFAHSATWSGGRRTALLGISGGELALAADIATYVGLEPHPLDLGALPESGESVEKLCANSIASLDADPAIDIIAIAQDAPAGVNAAQIPLYRQVVDAATVQCSKPVIIFTHVSAGLHPEVIASPRAVGLPILQGARQALLAIGHKAWYASMAGANPQEYRVDRERFQRALDVSDGIANRLLREYGIPVALEVFADTITAARAAARAIGFPVVLKLVSPDVTHKTNVGGVRLGLASQSDVERAFQEIASCACRAGVQFAGVLVAEQVPRGIELIVGVNQDAQFGPIVLVGLGGVLVEVLDRVALALPPLSTDAAYRLLQSFEGSVILPADLDAVVDALKRISELALDSAGVLRELDLNPLIVGRSGGCKVVDARMRLTPP